MRRRQIEALRPLALVAASVLTMLASPPATGAPQEHTQHVTLVAKRFSFEPAVIEVQQDDLVKITFRTEDVPHSFTIDDYRIARRVGAGQTTTFEFRADKVGTFPFYCNIKTEGGCGQMKGRLVVRPRK
jgi:heme/copper-type cytochrome/quinol oxidase subunit 2